MAITHKNDAFVGRIANTRLTKNFVGIFALAQRLPTSVTLKCSTSRGSNTSNEVKFYFKFKQIYLCTCEWLRLGVR